MRIDVRGRNVEVTDEVREAVTSRFKRVGNQVSDLARLEIELREERNPRIRDKFVAEGNLHLKGITLHAEERSPEILGAIHELAEDIRRQVKRHRDKRRKRQRTRQLVARMKSA